jgi:hypothetical protein
MRLLAPGLLLCVCLALAPADALAARPVKPVMSASVGTGSTVFRVVFRAGDTVNAGYGTYYEVRVKTSAGDGCRSRQEEYEVMARRGTRLTFVFNPGRRQWCGGRWSGSVYWVRDRNLSQDKCTVSPCVTRRRVGKFSFRVSGPHSPSPHGVRYAAGG